MRKVEDAILFLKGRLRYCVRATEVEKDVVEMAISSMEKQVPKEKRNKTMKINDYDSESYQCPSCNWHVELSDKYCRHCGQSLIN